MASLLVSEQGAPLLMHSDIEIDVWVNEFGH